MKKFKFRNIWLVFAIAFLVLAVYRASRAEYVDTLLMALLSASTFWDYVRSADEPG